MSGDPPHGALFTHVAHADRSYHKIYPMYSSMLFVPFTEAHSPSTALFHHETCSLPYFHAFPPNVDAFFGLFYLHNP